MSAIFISHSSADNDQVAGLKSRLESWNHHSLFLDFDPDAGIQAGRSWERTLYRKLRACRAVIAWCTDTYLQSYWCFAEIALTRMEGKPIFAILDPNLSENASLPSILTEKQFIDLRKGEDQAWLRLKNGLKELDILGVSGEWDPHDAPYLGLSYYDEKHAPVFFGREDETRAGLELINRGAPNLIMVLGASGSGKSSLARAGMLPRLRQDEDQYLVVAPFRPRQDPFRELADQLARAFVRFAPDHAKRIGNEAAIYQQLRDWRPRSRSRDNPVAPEAQVEQPAPQDERLHRLLTQLEELQENPPEPADQFKFLDWTLDDLKKVAWTSSPSPDSERTGMSVLLCDLADHLQRASERRNARVILVIDQFEELLGYESEGPDHPANRFLELLRATVDSDACPLLVLGTMRSDFLGTFQRNPALRGIDFESLSLGPMKLEGMRKVIEEPAKLGAIELEKGLADRLLDDTETPDALPLLSFTLWVLWRDYREDGKLAVAEYDELGGLEGAIAREADALLRSAETEGKADDLRRAFVRMARLSDQGAYARQPVNWDAEELKPVHGILDRFVDRRLLVKLVDGEETVVEVAHEALFRSWEPLKNWLDEDRADLLLKQQIERDAAAWEDADRPADRLWHGARLLQARELTKRENLPEADVEFISNGVRRRRKRRSAAFAVSVSIFIALLSLFLDAKRQKKIAEDNLEEAEQQKALARTKERKARIGEGRYYLELARLNAANGGGAIFPDVHLLAAKAIGFEGYGRPKDWNLIESGSKEWKIWNQYHPSLLLAPNERLIDSTDADWEIIETGWEFQEAQDLLRGKPGQLRPTLLWSTARAGRYSHERGVVSVAWSPDGMYIATGSWDGSVRVWNLSSLKSEPVVLQSDDIYDLAWSPYGKRLASGSRDGTVIIWDLSNLDEGERVIPQAGQTPEIAWSPDGNYIAIDWDYGPVHVYDFNGSETEPVVLERASVEWSPIGEAHLAIASYDTYQSLRIEDLAQDATEKIIFKDHDTTIFRLAWHPSGTQLATADLNELAVKVWNLEADAGAGPLMLEGLESRLNDLAWSPNGTQLAAYSSSQVALWDLNSLDIKTNVLNSSVRHLAWSPDSDYLAFASADETARIWDTSALGTEHGEPVILKVHKAEHVAWSPDGSRLATAERPAIGGIGGLGGTAAVWDIGTSVADPIVLRGHRDGVKILAWNDDRLASASHDGTARVWDLGAPVTAPLVLQGHKNSVQHLSWSPDGMRIATASFDATARVYDLVTIGSKTRFQPVVLQGHKELIGHVAWLPNGVQLATCSDDGTSRIWDLGSGGPRFLSKSTILQGHTEKVRHSAWHSDGSLWATASADGTVGVWDLSKPESEVKILQVHEEGVNHLAWHGGRLAAASEEGVHIWDLNTPESEPDLIEIDLGANILAWSPDGTRLAIAAYSRLEVWSPGSPETASVKLRGHDEKIIDLAWSPKGGLLATASHDATVRIWAETKERRKILWRDHSIEDHEGRPLCLAWNDDGTRLAVGSTTGTVRVWNVEGIITSKNEATLPDLAHFFTEGWAVWDAKERQFNWNDRPDRESAPFELGNGPAGSVTQLLKDANPLQLCRYHLSHHLGKPAWVWWGKLAPSEREEIASEMFQLFYARSARTANDAAPKWYQSRLDIIRQERESEVLFELNTIPEWRLGYFVGAIAAGQTGSDLEDMALTSLDILENKLPDSHFPICRSILLHRLGQTDKGIRVLGTLLTDHEKTKDFGVLVLALQRLLNERSTPSREEDQWLVQNALRIVQDGDDVDRESFFTRLGASIGSEGVNSAKAKAILAMMPDDSARKWVSKSAIEWIPAKIGMVKDFPELSGTIDEAHAWRAESIGSILLKVDEEDLVRASRLALNSEDPKAITIALETSSSLMKVAPKPISFLYHSRALAKAGKLSEAVNFCEKALSLSKVMEAGLEKAFVEGAISKELAQLRDQSQEEKSMPRKGTGEEQTTPPADEPEEEAPPANPDPAPQAPGNR